MLDKDVDGIVGRFMKRIEGKEFTMTRSPNTEENYTASKQERVSIAVEEFVETDLFQDMEDTRITVTG